MGRSGGGQSPGTGTPVALEQKVSEDELQQKAAKLQDDRKVFWRDVMRDIRAGCKYNIDTYQLTDSRFSLGDKGFGSKGELWLEFHKPIAKSTHTLRLILDLKTREILTVWDEIM